MNSGDIRVDGVYEGAPDSSGERDVRAVERISGAFVVARQIWPPGSSRAMTPMPLGAFADWAKKECVRDTLDGD